MENSELYLRRKMDDFLSAWKMRPGHMPLVVRGARQIGKSETIRRFSDKNYKYKVEINFATQPEYRTVCKDGYSVEAIIKNITLINPSLIIEPGETIFFFDEIQDYIELATALKSFREDGRFDVICSGSMMGINYQKIESNAVGNKEDVEMHSMDFEEFLWALDYKDEQIDGFYKKMQKILPLSETEYNVLLRHFREYMVLGGMPAIVKQFILSASFVGSLNLQRQILLDYEEDITKYANGLDQTKILNVYRKIAVFLGNENKKFQISKVEDGARNREYVGVVDWLERSGIINICYCLDRVALPLKGNYDPNNFRIYFSDTGLLIGSLDDEVQDDLRKNQNLNTYKGAIYENIVSDILIKAGYNLYFYRNEKGTIEMDFFVRDKSSLIPVEVKANDGATASLNNLIESDKYPDIQYGIKFCNKNIGWNGKFYTFPYFLAFLLKRFLAEK
ncbi:MAG: DUF4143 domain-containing protein [Candidatus Saccharibacteria bacterium]|nr:DUF4143 domain-containing protein [Candidatus Saccharibacteria bacterium]